MESEQGNRFPFASAHVCRTYDSPERRRPSSWYSLRHLVPDRGEHLHVPHRTVGGTGQPAPVRRFSPAIRRRACTNFGGVVQSGVRSLGPRVPDGHTLCTGSGRLFASLHLNVPARLLDAPDLQYADALYLRRQRRRLPRSLPLHRSVPRERRGGHGGAYAVQHVFHGSHCRSQWRHRRCDGGLFSALSACESPHHRALLLYVVHVAPGVDRAWLFLRRTVPPGCRDLNRGTWRHRRRRRGLGPRGRIFGRNATGEALPCSQPPLPVRWLLADSNLQRAFHWHHCHLGQVCVLWEQYRIQDGLRHALRLDHLIPWSVWPELVPDVGIGSSGHQRRNPPCFDALYAAKLGKICLAAAERLFTMVAPRDISGIAAREHRNRPVRLTSSTDRHNSSGVFSTRNIACEMPALLTRMSSRPQCFFTRANTAATESASRTSQLWASTFGRA